MKQPAGPERRRQIAEATLQLAGAHGVEGTTTARIAALVGMSEPALYRYFPNRREMLLAALDIVGERIIVGVHGIEHPDTIERLRLIGRHHSESFARAEDGFVDSLFRFVTTSAREGLGERVRDISLRTAAALAQVVDEGKAKGYIRSDVDSRATALRFMGVYWYEDVAYLMGLTEIIEAGLSTQSLEGILREIA